MSRVNIKETNLKFGSLSNRTKTLAIVIHHVGNINRDVSAAEIHGWHLNQGWAGIGYHLVIRKDGTIERGRPLKKIGSHCLNHNAYTIGINVVGDFENNEPENKQIDSLVKVLADLCDTYNISPSKSTIVGHRDKMATTCPGKNLYNKLNTIITKTSNLLNNKISTTDNMSCSLLKKGNKGDLVKGLQTKLKKHGYKLYTDTYGVFGSGTEKSVKQFQSDNKLTVDGIVGPQTLNKLT